MKRANVVVLILMGLLLISAWLNGQISTFYAFDESVSAWEQIAGTSVQEAMVEDGISYPIDIGFTFPYGANSYTQVKVSSNGWINLGTNLTNPIYSNGLATLNYRPVVAPLWDDLDMTYGLVQYGTFGDEPSRVFVMQWLAARWNRTATNEYYFMAKLHENGQVDFIYGPHSGSPVNASATIGLNMNTPTVTDYMNILPGIPAVYSTTSQYNSLATPLPEGTMYLFMPKTTYNQDAAAVNLHGSQTPMQHVASDFVITVGNAGAGSILSDAVTVYLKRGDDILATGTSPSMTAGYFRDVAVSWAPDTTGIMNLTAQVALNNDANNLNNLSLPFTITPQPYVGNDDNTAPPAAFIISAYPNPFSSRVSLTYNLEKRTPVSLLVYNLLGQKVNELVISEQSAGSHLANWDGLDAKGVKVPNGIYFARLQTGKHSATVKLVVIR